MATRSPENRTRNDAIALIDEMFGAEDGWVEAASRAYTAIDVAQELYDLRSRHKLTQKALAAKAGTTQSVISRLEHADYDGHSMQLLTRIAASVGERVLVKFVPDDITTDPRSASSETPAGRRKHSVEPDGSDHTHTDSNTRLRQRRRRDPSRPSHRT